MEALRALLEPDPRRVVAEDVTTMAAELARLSADLERHLARVRERVKALGPTFTAAQSHAIETHCARCQNTVEALRR